MLLYVNPVVLDDFELAPFERGGCLVANLAGTADGSAIAPLRDCVAGILRELSRGAHSTLEFDIRRLCLLNSSCLRVLLAFLNELQTSGARVSIRFLVNAQLAWQPRALVALERLAPAMVSIVPS